MIFLPALPGESKMRFIASRRKPISVLVAFAFATMLCLWASPAAAAPKEPAAKNVPAAALEKDDGGSTGFLEQEGSAPVTEERLKVSWLVVSAVAVLAVAAVYFLVIKKPNKDAANTRIQVNSVPDGATVYMDGRNTGRLTPATFTNVTPGYHNIKLTKDGYGDYSTSLQVKSGQTTVVDAVLSET